MQDKVLLIVLLFAYLVPLQQGCRSGMWKRKKREVNDLSDTEEVRLYYAACLEEKVGMPNSYDWQSNVDYAILLSNWYLNTETVICSTVNDYDTANCWSEEIEEFLENDPLLPFVKECIQHYFEDHSQTLPDPRFPRTTTKRSVSTAKITNPPQPGRINKNYSTCLSQDTSHPSINYQKLLASVERHSVLRKCDYVFRSRPLDYQRKFLALTRPDKQLRTTIDKCNKRHFPAGYFWTDWSPWSECRANATFPSCKGLKQRARRCFDGDNPKDQQNPSRCPGFAKQEKQCTRYACWTKWGSWTTCSVACGSGKRSRTRTCRYRNRFQDRALTCPGEAKQWGMCKLSSCGQAQLCGGQMVVSNTINQISTPNYPLAYHNDLNCTWVLNAPPGEQVECLFSVIDTEKCCDFLKVRDGSDKHAKVLFTPLSGFVNRTYYFVSTFGSLHISFIADDSITGNGFRAQCRVAPVVGNVECGGSITAGNSSELISTPNWPLNYGSNQFCVWTVTAPLGQQVLLRVISYQLETCCDSVVARDGDTQSSEILGYFVGQSTKNLTYVSTNRVIQLRFRSDFSQNFIGFVASVRAVDDGLYNRITTDAPPVEECDFEYTVPQTGHGNITSPNWPNNHSGSVSCTWVLVAPPGERIRVWFAYVNTESCCDWIKVRDGSSATSTKLGVISGNGGDFHNFVSTSNYLRVEFDSDSDLNKRGFKAYYEIFRSGEDSRTSTCGNNNLMATESIQYFSSPGYPNANYPNGTTCTWKLRGPFGSRLEIELLGIILEQNFDYLSVYNSISIFSQARVRLTGKHYTTYSIKTTSNEASNEVVDLYVLQVYNGISIFSRRLVRLTGKHYTTWKIRTSSNDARLVLTTDNLVSHAGFRATYKAFYEESSDLTADGGIGTRR